MLSFVSISHFTHPVLLAFLVGTRSELLMLKASRDQNQNVHHGKLTQKNRCTFPGRHHCVVDISNFGLLLLDRDRSIRCFVCCVVHDEHEIVFNSLRLHLTNLLNFDWPFFQVPVSSSGAFDASDIMSVKWEVQLINEVKITWTATRCTVAAGKARGPASPLRQASIRFPAAIADEREPLGSGDKHTRQYYHEHTA